MAAGNDPILAEITTAASHRFGMPAIVFAKRGKSLDVVTAASAPSPLPEGLEAAVLRHLDSDDRETSVVSSPETQDKAPFVVIARLGSFQPAALCLIDERHHDLDGARLRLLDLFAEAATERVGGEGERATGSKVLEPVTGVYTKDFLERLCRAELQTTNQACLLLFRIDGAEAIRKQRGPHVALRLVAQLSDQIRAHTRSSDFVGRFASDVIALLLPSAPAQATSIVASKLHSHLKRSFRFPISIGAASGSEEKSLFWAAEEALKQSVADGGNCARVYSKDKIVAPQSAAPAERPQGPSSTSLQARYQKLALLNRIALGLFSKGSLDDSLSSVSHNILALAGGKLLRLLRRRDSGELVEIHRLGEPRIIDDEDGETILKQAVIAAKAATAASWNAFRAGGLYSVPITDGAGKLEGALLIGFAIPDPPNDNVRLLLTDVAKMLASGFRADKQHQEHETLTSVFAQAADPVFLTDANNRITVWGRGAEETFGLKPEEVIGKTHYELTVPKDKVEELKQFEAEAMEKGFFRGEAEGTRRDGSRFPVEFTLSVLKDNQGAPFGMVRILRDITRRKEIDRLKADFIAMVTHDLRTPLNSIRGFSDSMLEYWDRFDDPEKKKYLHIILRESKRLGRLVDDFLDLTRFEKGDIELYRESTELKEVAARAVETLKGSAPELKFDVDFPEGFPEVSCDREELLRVFINLGGNAIKYSPSGKTVRLSGTALGKEVECRVTDEGPGLSEEEAKKIFQKFYRVSDEVTRSITGTGLGLTICKNVIEAHGGTIGVDGRPGKGASFWFRIPILPEEE